MEFCSRGCGEGASEHPEQVLELWVLPFSAQQNEVATSTHLLVVGETLRICRYLASSLQREKDLSQ